MLGHEIGVDVVPGGRRNDGDEARLAVGALFDSAADGTTAALGPKGEVIHAPRSTPEKKYQRGSLPAPANAGEYLLEIKGAGKDIDGSPVSDAKTVHFMVVAENLELQRKAPDHDLLTELAKKSGGEFAFADEARRPSRIVYWPRPKPSWCAPL